MQSIVHVHPTRAEMGAAAAREVIDELRTRLAEQDRVRVVFAAAPSQSEALDAIIDAEGIDWTRVDAFHMDEYIGLPPGAPERFAQWLKANLFDRLPFGSVHLIVADDDPDAAARAYAADLGQAPVDLVLCGIGVNGHIAFNDPPVADFDDPFTVKVVELDDTCRQQQVDDECFATLDDVPTHAVTLTVPCLMSARRIVCVVPGSLKAPAVAATFAEPVGTRWPSTILRTHPNVGFHVDADAARDLS